MGPADPERHRRRRRRPLRTRASLRHRVRRHPAAVRYWLLVAAVAVALTSSVGRVVERADQAEEAWGRTETVYVVHRPVRAGAPLAGSVRAERWPAALVPDRALTRPPATGRSVTALDPGTPLTSSSVDAAGPGGGRSTIAVPLPDSHLPVRDGERVDVWATADPATVADGEAATRRVATGAVVVGAATRSVVVAVDPRQVAEVAHAAATATLTLVGTG